jgi:predicted permease
MDLLLADLLHAARGLRRAPGFALAAVLMLGVGLGASTALFSVVQAVLVRPLPLPDSERLVRLHQVGGGGRRMNVSGPNFEDVAARSRSFAALARTSPPSPVSVTGGGEPVRALSVAVSQGYFAALGVVPARGRPFLPEEAREGGAPAVVVGHGFWQRSLGGREDLSGLTLGLGGRAHAVVGVMPPGVVHPGGAELWTPAELEGGPGSRTAHNWEVLGRLAPGVRLEAARGELTALARALKAEHGDGTWMEDVALVPLQEQLVGAVRPALLALLSAAGLLLLVAGANVANLLLARASARGRELAVRVALGAGRGQLVRQFLCESLLLTLAGAAAGAALAFAGVGALRALGPGRLPRLDEVAVDGPALLFALGLAVLLALALGTSTALRATGSDLAGTLASGLRSAGGGGGGRVRGALVAAQVALALVLLAGAALLARSLVDLLAVEPGYRAGELVVLSLSQEPPRGEAAERERAGQLDALEARLAALPGVASVGGASAFPLGEEGGGNGTFLVLTRPDEVQGFEDFQRLLREPGRAGEAEFRLASAGHFRTLGIPLLQGRTFGEADGPDAPHVAVVSASLARAQWPGQDPLGKLVQFGNMDGDLRAFTVVGVVGDVREDGPDAPARPTLYAHVRQRPRGTWVFHVALRPEAGVTAAALVAPARAALRQVAPDVPPRVRTLQGLLSDALAPRRFSLALLGAFGAAALLLAGLGLSAVVAFSVARRTREFGVRLALGATGGDVQRLVLRQAALLAGAGLAAGWALALAGGRVLRSLVPGVAGMDPLALLAVTALLGGVALLAAWLPARRASRVDPQVALRAE